VYDLFPGEQLHKSLQTALSSNFNPQSPPEFSVEGTSLRGGKALIRVFPLGRDEEENKGYAIVLEEYGGARTMDMGPDQEPVSAKPSDYMGFISDGYTGLDTKVKERPKTGRMDSELLLRPAPVPPLDEVPLDRLPCTVFDLETTGLDPDGGDEIVSLSAVRLLNNRFLDEEPFHQLIDPGREIPRKASRIHGINGEMVEGKPSASQVLTSFRFYSRDSVLVAHCAEFDMLFLHKKETETEAYLENPVLDTLLLAALVLSSSKDLSLDATAKRLEATTHSRHTSLGDALTAAEIYIKLVPMLANEGIRTLSQARQVCRRMKKCVDYSRNPRLCNLQTC
jgi:DNA polymerase III epsilon subunit family exonuclease